MSTAAGMRSWPFRFLRQPSMIAASVALAIRDYFYGRSCNTIVEEATRHLWLSRPCSSIFLVGRCFFLGRKHARQNRKKPRCEATQVREECVLCGLEQTKKSRTRMCWERRNGSDNNNVCDVNTSTKQHLSWKVTSRGIEIRCASRR